MGLVTLITGLAVFLGVHTFITARGARAALIARIGEGPYKGLFSVIAIAGVVLIAYGFGQYRAHGMVNVWYPPNWTRHLAFVLVWLAFVCVVAAYIPGHIKRALKHPMLVGVKLWAVAHLLVNGDIGSIVLFGSILAWAVYDRILLKRRLEPEPPLRVPYGGLPSDIIAAVIATLVYLGFGFVFHPVLIGVPVFI